MSDDDETLEESLAGMTRYGQLGVVGWRDGEPLYANTAYAVRGWRFDWARIRSLAIVGVLVPEAEATGCDHDPSRWGAEPGLVECALGCGATWRATLAPTPDPHA